MDKLIPKEEQERARAKVFATSALKSLTELGAFLKQRLLEVSKYLNRRYFTRWRIVSEYVCHNLPPKGPDETTMNSFFF